MGLHKPIRNIGVILASIAAGSVVATAPIARAEVVKVSGMMAGLVPFAPDGEFIGSFSGEYNSSAPTGSLENVTVSSNISNDPGLVKRFNNGDLGVEQISLPLIEPGDWGVSIYVATSSFSGAYFDQSLNQIDFGGYATVTETPIPEPATWALMLVGFGLAGVALRRRRGSRQPSF